VKADERRLTLRRFPSPESRIPTDQGRVNAISRLRGLISKRLGVIRKRRGVIRETVARIRSLGPAFRYNCGSIRCNSEDVHAAIVRTSTSLAG
jgi:hypothetical protein